ncbi:uncharacterized protein LOC129241637 [Anastrepha obliqua]|uniref:uncharacterized protein LOC129241637 n=1 Tax=Anastrepha obliqua TaxID=95512 RepID=UPI00240951BB|nr:uncharacterized protein LOC129241637 [Anastrepha obliqua]
MEREKWKTYWDCNRLRKGGCSAKAVTVMNSEDVIILRGPAQSKHDIHPPNREDGETEVIVDRLNRVVSSHPEHPPAQIIRAGLADVPVSVLTQLSNCKPQKIMEDFEKAIINACADIYPGTDYSGCFYHFCQSLYRKIQAEGLQELYNNPINGEIKVWSHTLMALAFVPEEDVALTFCGICGG